MTQPRQTLGQVLVQIEKAATQAPGRALVIFDLDSTLFDVSHRTQKILEDFSTDEFHRKLYPASVEILHSLRVDPRDWGIKTALIRGGLHTHPHEFLEAVRKYWIDRFFSGDYLTHDRPLAGAVEFVRRVAATGARLVYLTGRDRESMEEASKMVLATHGFPPAELVMKPSKGADDALFKVHWFDRQNLRDYSPVYFFENEPMNLHEVGQKHPEVRMIFVDTTHSGKSAVAPEWSSIKNFLLTGGG